MYSRKIVALSFLLATLSIAAYSDSEKLKTFRIGTGGVSGTYYPVGKLIARAISNPPGSDMCKELPDCGVPGLMAVAQVSNGSVSNVNAIANGTLEAGLVQSDVAYWAHMGVSVFSAQPAVSDLRAIANLYPEHLHIITRRDGGINAVSDLRDKRVSLDEPGSGTLVDARIVLAAYGLTEQDIRPEYLKPELAIKLLVDNNLDAFFIVAGYPVSSLEGSETAGHIKLVPVHARERSKLVNQYNFLTEDSIPAEMYSQASDTPTVSVSAILVTSSRVEESLIYDITRALWNENSRLILDHGHMKGRSITLETALDGLGIPLHDGALRFYREQGLLPQ
jgi:TRAP transporter TAXI family solute receptor